MQAIGRVLAAVAVSVVVLVMTLDARAQENLDRDKSGPKLFAASCVQCHKSARGLAKGRISFMLRTTCASTTPRARPPPETLTAYLQSVDTPPGKANFGRQRRRPASRGRRRRRKAKSQPKNVERIELPIGTISDDPRVQPPAKVPGR